ncbi:hypothetical protein G7Y89_g11374 [Cudoniella acicularis]|uniref:Uncharacterized protein n=1 Tax=Cudoniella acicularis TaxID=354080 RepID=A0A8H4REL7_9HELO|nr:hypothetical protein G7Y89_g11374 [Cudoniella acicularis]
MAARHPIVGSRTAVVSEDYLFPPPEYPTWALWSAARHHRTDKVGHHPIYPNAAITSLKQIDLSILNTELDTTIPPLRGLELDEVETVLPYWRQYLTSHRRMAEIFDTFLLTIICDDFLPNSRYGMHLLPEDRARPSLDEELLKQFLPFWSICLVPLYACERTPIEHGTYNFPIERALKETNLPPEHLEMHARLLRQICEVEVRGDRDEYIETHTTNESPTALKAPAYYDIKSSVHLSREHLSSMSSPALFAVLLFAGHAQGYTKFNTVCTAPNSTVNFVSSPDTRGTLDILWSCLFTMIACTYTVLHLNVPEQRAGRDPGWRGDLKWTVRGVWVSVKWMLVTILAPEILLSKNWGDLEFAKTATAMMERFAATDGVPWTLTHSLLANMGGFIIKGNFTIPAAGNLSELQELPKTTWQEITGNLDEGNELATILIENASAGKTIGTSHNAQSDSELLLDNGSREQTEQLFHVDALDIFRLRELGLLRSLPNTSLEEVKDKDKTDTFARVITVTQISWMVLQVITRAARHLPISQLEIAVVAFAACAIIIFGLNWQKPRSVKVPFTLPSIVEKTDTHDLQSVLQSIATRRAHTNVDSGVIEMFLVTARMGKKLPSRPGNPIRNTYSGTVTRKFVDIADTLHV